MILEENILIWTLEGAWLWLQMKSFLKVPWGFRISCLGQYVRQSTILPHDDLERFRGFAFIRWYIDKYEYPK